MSHYVSINGKITRIICQRAARKHQISCRTFLFKPDLKEFVEDAAAEGVQETTKVEILKCQSAFDEKRRCNTVCVLLGTKQKKGENFHYFLLKNNSSNHLQASLEFTLSYQITGNVSIFQGPTVTWTHDGSVFHVLEGKVSQTPVHLSNMVFGQLPIRRGQIFIVGQKTSGDTVGFLLEDGKTFDATQIFPQPYLCVLRCVQVLSACHVHGGLRSTAVAATSSRQLVYFEDSVVKETLRLPFEGPEDIRVVDTGRNGLLVVVSFHHGNVCAVWKETFQIAAQWSSVTSVHVDDFLRCGTDQLVLIFKGDGSMGSSLDNFLITDLCGISFSQGQEKEATKKSLPENYLLTLRALESRLQSGLTVLEELQRDVRVKERVLRQSVRALADAVSQRDTSLTPHEQEGLVPLWDCDDESKDESWGDMTGDAPALPAKPRVDKLWHRISEERLVVGVILSADNHTPPAAVSLSIVTATEASFTPAVIHTRCQVLRPPPLAPAPPTPSAACEPAAKRRKHRASDGGRGQDQCVDRVAVTAVTAVAPLLNSDSVKCRIMLHYVQGPEALALQKNPAPLVLQCGQILLDIRESFQTQLEKTPDDKTDGALEDFLTQLAVLDHWIFQIDSPEHSLGDIEGWMETSMACKRVEVNPKYLIKSAETSTALLLHWQQLTPFMAELIIHSRHVQVLQFLHSFLPFLPESCSVQLVKRSRVQDSAVMLPAVLHKELLSVQEFLSLLQPKQQGDKPPEAEENTDPGSAEELRRCREVWKQEGERSRTCLSPLLDVERYRTLMQKLTGIQLETDLSALVETQRIRKV